MPANRWRLDLRRVPPAPAPLRQRVVRFVRRTVDRLRGRLGARVIRLPGRVLVVAESVESLRHLSLRRPLATRRVTVVVAWWRAPAPGWSGRIGALGPVRRQRVRSVARVRGRGPATVDIVLSEATPLSTVLAAAATALRPYHPLPTSAEPISAAVSARRVNAATSAERTSAAMSAGPAGAATSLAQTSLPQAPRVLVDATRVNPRGRRLESYRPDAPRLTLEFAAPSLALLDRWRRGVGPDLSWPAIGALRSVGAVTCGDVPGRHPATEASVLVQLAMTGVVLHAPNVDDRVGGLMAPALLDILREPPPGDGELDMEARSVRQRRTALRLHSTRFGGDAPAPTVSALLATRRPEHLPGALRAIATQSYPSVEIVVCLHGIDLPPECRSYLEECGRPYEVVAVGSDVSFGTALGLATARAGGALITKFDDDDTYGPDHIWDLVLARHYSGATLIGKGAEFVFLEDAGLTIRRWSGRPESDDSLVAGGTMLIGKGDLERLGGWRPIPRSVDRGLVDRIHREGATIYRTHPLEYLYHRRSQGHTWDPGTDFFLQNTRAQWPGAHLP